MPDSDGESSSTLIDTPELEEPEWKLPKSDVTFAFGPSKWYFVRCGGRWRFVRSSKSDWNDLTLEDATWVAFKHNTGFFIGGTTTNGLPRLHHTWNDGHLVPAGEIDAFVKTRDAYVKLFDSLASDKLNDTHVAIAANGSYFARCGSSWISHNLPSDLSSRLEEEVGKRFPAIVALGIRGSWIVLWTDGTRTWNLDGYPSLLRAGDLQIEPEDDKNPVVFVALDPYQEDRYFVARANGGIMYKTTLSKASESEKLNQMTNEYMASRAKQSGIDFSHPYTRDGVTRYARITKDGYHEDVRSRLAQAWRDRKGLDVLMRKGNLQRCGAVAGGAAIISKISGAPMRTALSIGLCAGAGAAVATLFND